MCEALSLCRLCTPGARVATTYWRPNHASATMESSGRRLFAPKTTGSLRKCVNAYVTGTPIAQKTTNGMSRNAVAFVTQTLVVHPITSGTSPSASVSAIACVPMEKC